MINLISKLWNSDSLSPHGICLLWRPELIWSHAISDAVIGLSYLSISIFLACVLSRRPDIKFGWVVWCFSIFILACGGTHFLSILTLWSPDYGLEAMVKIVTALASLATAVLLWPLLPAALAWPSPERLAVVNSALEEGLKERDAALLQLRLEMAERTRVQTLLVRAQKMDALGQLTGGLAHDYNNILTIITMNLARISKIAGAQTADEIRRSIDHARQAVDRAAAITRRLLSFSRQKPMNVALADVAGTIESIAPLLQDALGDKRDLRFDLATGLPSVSLDKGEFETAVLNLVLNARDATPDGGVITVETRLSELDGRPMVMVRVADTGQGMSQEIIDKAFDPFFTTKPVGQGSGLGLSQVFGFVRQLAGTVNIDSLPQKGTTVSVLLPAGGG